MYPVTSQPDFLQPFSNLVRYVYTCVCLCVCQMPTRQPSVQRVAMIKGTVSTENVTASLVTLDQHVLKVSSRSPVCQPRRDAEV